MSKTDRPLVWFDVLANNGYRYEYVTRVQATTVQQARTQFKQKYGGDYRTTDFKVRRVKEIVHAYHA